MPTSWEADAGSLAVLNAWWPGVLTPEQLRDASAKRRQVRRRPERHGGSSRHIRKLFSGIVWRPGRLSLSVAITCCVLSMACGHE